MAGPQRWSLGTKAAILSVSFDGLTNSCLAAATNGITYQFN